MSDDHEVDESIIMNVVHTLVCAEIWTSRNSLDRWRKGFRLPLKWDHAETEKQLFGAALCTNTLPYIRRSAALRDAMFSDTINPDNSCLFGNFIELAVKFGNQELLEYLMTSGALESIPDLRFRLFKFAAKAGRIDIVRFLHNYRSEEWPWHFEDDENARESQLDTILEHVLDPRVWDFVETLRIARGMPPTSRKAIYWKIRSCARLGFLDMATFLVRVGAHTEEGRDLFTTFHSSLSDYQISCIQRDEAVKVASERGFVAIVELLLDDGADSDHTLASAARGGKSNVLELLLDREINIDNALFEVPTMSTSVSSPAELLASTQTRSYLDVVRLLLDAGVDVNESIGKESPLAGAIAAEHTALYEFLLKRGADLHTPGTAEECVRRAKQDGLESMLLLL